MPLLRSHRQGSFPPPPGNADAQGWFGGDAGQALLRSESGAVQRVLAACPALPWVWFGVPAAPAPAAGRGLVLRQDGRCWNGAVRCGLPVPLASESFGAVLLQHVLDDGEHCVGLLEECARLLAPGGTLWLAALNPWAPYRLRWGGTGLCARTPGGWQSLIRRAGLPAGAVQLQWLGPVWRLQPGPAGVGARDLSRAALALTVTKRVHAGVRPGALRSLRWHPAVVPSPRHASGQASGAAAGR